MKFLHEIQFSSEQQALNDVYEYLYQTKIVVLRNVEVSVDELDFYSRLSNFLGSVFDVDEDIYTGELTGNRWIDIRYDPEIQDRYRTAKVHQPLHTDDSYIPHDNSVTFFFSKSRAPKGGATVFLDSEELIELLKLDNEYELLDALYHVPVCFSKAGSKRTRPILTRDELGLSLNYNYYCLDENNGEEAVQTVNRLHNFLEKRVRDAGILLPVMLEKGDAVLFHDQRLLHGRNSYFARKAGDRYLKKGSVILNLEELLCRKDEKAIS